MKSVVLRLASYFGVRGGKAPLVACLLHLRATMRDNEFEEALSSIPVKDWEARNEALRLVRLELETMSVNELADIEVEALGNFLCCYSWLANLGEYPEMKALLELTYKLADEVARFRRA